MTLHLRIRMSHISSWRSRLAFLAVTYLIELILLMSVQKHLTNDTAPLEKNQAVGLLQKAFHCEALTMYDLSFLNNL